MTHPDPTTQLQQLRAGTPIVVPARRGKIALAVVATAAFGVVGVLLMILALSSFAEVGPLVLLSKPFIGGTLAVLVFGGWLLPSGIRGLARQRRLVLDTEGFAEEVLRTGRWEQTSRLAWTEVEEFTVQRVGAMKLYRGTKLVCYRLTEAAAARRPSPGSRIARWVSAADANLLGPRTVAMASVFGRAGRLHELLSSARREYGAQPPVGSADHFTEPDISPRMNQRPSSR